MIVALSGWALAGITIIAFIRAVDRRPEPLPQRQPLVVRGFRRYSKPRVPANVAQLEHWDAPWWEHVQCGRVYAGMPHRCPACSSTIPHPSSPRPIPR